MKLSSNNLQEGERVPDNNAFAVIDPDTHIALAANRSPHLAWSDIPEGTRSFAITCCDPDVPSKPDDVNQEGREVPASLPRVDFYHWVLWNLSADITELAEGEHADGITPRGKGPEAAPGNTRHGRNDYTSFFAGDADMEGDYFGYDGPCPPWNDALLHHYVFTVYALDVDSLTVAGNQAGSDLLDAMEGHVLAKAGITTTYTLNPSL